MALSAVVSVASFSVVLAETFAAVGLSSIVPAGVVTLARVIKNADASGASSTDLFDQIAGKAGASGTDPIPGQPGAGSLAGLVKTMAKSLPSLDLLLPKTAHIHAEFTFEAKETDSAHVTVGMPASSTGIVSIDAGFSALYEDKSTNKITLDIDFVSVNIPL